jgi:hypothetical protein
MGEIEERAKRAKRQRKCKGLGLYLWVSTNPISVKGHRGTESSGVCFCRLFFFLSPFVFRVKGVWDGLPMANGGVFLLFFS